MTKLILPNNELVTTQAPALIMPDRRGFFKGVLGVLAGAVAAPMICSAENLMKIESELNRLVFAFKKPGDHRSPFHDAYAPSFLNLVSFTDPVVRAAWESRYPWLKYSIVRQGEILPQYEKCYGGGYCGEPLSPARIKEETRWAKDWVDDFKADPTRYAWYERSTRMV